MSYDQFAQTFSNSRKNLKWPELDFIIEDMRKHNYSKILDIGCGNGRFLEEAGRLNLHIDHYLGLDSSSGMIKEARKLHGEYSFEVIGMQDLSQINMTFDSLLFLASFHHLETREERLQVLRDAKKLLTPHGRAYLTNWNLLGQEKYEKSHRGRGDFDIKIGEFSRYYHGFTVEELAELFCETDWTIIKNEVFEGGRNIMSVVSTGPV